MTKNSELYPDFGKNIINEFETNYPQLSNEFKQIQQEQYRLFASKMMDYGIQNIALGSTLENEEDIKFSITGIWLRCNDNLASSFIKAIV